MKKASETLVLSHDAITVDLSAQRNSKDGWGLQIWVKIVNVSMPQPQKLLVLVRSHLCLAGQPDAMAWRRQTRQHRLPLSQPCVVNVLKL
jgi:hypothetical protein